VNRVVKKNKLKQAHEIYEAEINPKRMKVRIDEMLE